jgi:hypothetical protein
MKLIDNMTDKLVGALLGAHTGKRSLQATLDMAEAAIVSLQEDIGATKEGIVELELAIDEGTEWRRLNDTNNTDFSPAFLTALRRRSWLMYLINPLIKRAVTIQELYVWGSGCTIKAENEVVDEVLHDFFDDPDNQEVIGRSWPVREREQRIYGDQFFVFFTNPRNGRVRVRCIPVEQIVDVYHNPNDSTEVWFYKRQMNMVDGVFTYEYLPSVCYTPRVKPTMDYKVQWDTPIYHNKTGGMSNMKFGVPELYSALNWATAYKGMLENFATVLKALARLAFKISNLPGKKGISAAKSRLQSSITHTEIIEKNPTEVPGSTFLGAGNTTIEPIKTSNSTTGPDEARALRVMVAAGTDTPEHFFGDSDVGNFATSSTLDRPTELKMVARQKMWEGIIREMCEFVILASADAPRGKLRVAGFSVKTLVGDFSNKEMKYVLTTPADTNMTVTVEFPSILSRDVIDRVRSIVMAATMNGSKAEGIFPDRKFLFKNILVALDIKNAEEIANEMYPEPVTQGFIDPVKELANETKVADAKLIAANKPVAAPFSPPKNSK